jgi:hypothetical protein
MSKVLSSANGVTGQLIWCHNKYMFRVYDAEHDFVDYDIYHSDLTITIKDADAFFYQQDVVGQYLDHAPETLGHNHE